MSHPSDPDLPLKDAFILAMDTNSVENFKQLVTKSSGLWRQVQTNSGNTLLQELIIEDKQDMFKFLLEFCDVEYLETLNLAGQTAINVAISQDGPLSSYYVPDLVKKYQTIPSHYDRDLLHWSLHMGALETAKHLLEKGVDPNTRSGKDGGTPLHKIIQSGYIGNSYEYIAMLLFYKANPFLKFQKLNAFEMSILGRRALRTLPVHELLFEYTFDGLEHYQINFKVLLELARLQSPLFHRLLEYDVDFIVERVPLDACGHNVRLLFILEIDYLKIILEKHYSHVCDSFRDCHNWSPILGDGICRSLNFQYFLNKLKLFLESGSTMTQLIPVFLARVSCWDLFRRVLILGRPIATEMITFMSLHGLQIPRQALDLVYTSYGYCELFKFFLHKDYIESHQTKQDVLIVSLIRDIHKDLDSCLQTATIYSKTKLLDVLDFFAHRKLTEFLWKKIQDEDLQFQEKDLQKLRDHPQIPRLVELGRNTFRKYLVERYQVESTRQFYNLVGNLDIGSNHKRIITFETKVY